MRPTVPTTRVSGEETRSAAGILGQSRTGGDAPWALPRAPDLPAGDGGGGRAGTLPPVPLRRPFLNAIVFDHTPDLRVEDRAEGLDPFVPFARQPFALPSESGDGGKENGRLKAIGGTRILPTGRALLVVRLQIPKEYAPIARRLRRVPFTRSPVLPSGRSEAFGTTRRGFGMAQDSRNGPRRLRRSWIPGTQNGLLPKRRAV